jgi:hypothetical protein
MMMALVFVVAQQTLNFFQVAREGLWELYLFFMQTIRDGRIAWVLVIVVGVLIYQRFLKK